MERLFYVPTAGPTPPPKWLRGVEQVQFTSADGTPLQGWFVPAMGTEPRSAPTILHVHGNAGNMLGHIGFSGHLPGEGFNLFIFDYRGYGQSGGSPWRRRDLIADADAALEVLLKHPQVDPDRIGLYGVSLGGAIALNMMADRPELKAAVIESAFTSWRDIAACVVGGGAEPGMFSRGLAACLIADHCRADDAIARIGHPVLLLHGTADSIIPVQHSRRLRDAAPNARLIEYSGGDHNTLQETHPHIQRDMTDFLRENLPPPTGQ